MAKKDKKKNNGVNVGAVPPMAPPVGVVPPAGGMNSTGMYPPPMGGVNSTGMYPPPMGGVNSTGMYPPPMGGMNSTGIYTGTATTTTTYQTAAAPAADTGKKGKKAKGKGKKNPNTVSANVDISKFNAEQMAQYQLDEALRESVDPSSRLKKLKSPLSVGGCLAMLAIFIVVTTIAVFFVCWIMVDKFNPLVIAKSMLDELGITDFFIMIGNWFKTTFGGKGVIELLSMFM